MSNILKTWIKNFFEDFETQEALLQRLNCFLLDNSQKPGYESIFTMLIGNIKRKVCNYFVHINSSQKKILKLN